MEMQQVRNEVREGKEENNEWDRESLCTKESNEENEPFGKRKMERGDTNLGKISEERG